MNRIEKPSFSQETPNAKPELDELSAEVFENDWQNNDVLERVEEEIGDEATKLAAENEKLTSLGSTLGGFLNKEIDFKTFIKNVWKVLWQKKTGEDLEEMPAKTANGYAAQTALGLEKALEPKDITDSLDDWESRYISAATYSASVEHMWANGFRQETIRANRSIVSRGETLQTLLDRSGFQGESQRIIEEMKQMGLKTSDKKIPEGYHVYLSKDGLIVDIRKEKTAPQKVSTEGFTKGHEKITDSYEILESQMKVGDFVIVSGRGVESEVIETSQGGFRGSHIMTKTKEGELIHTSPSKGVTTVNTRDYMKYNTTGDFIILQNPIYEAGLSDAEEQREIKLFLDGIRKHTGEKYGMARLTAVSKGETVEENVPHVCTSLVEAGLDSTNGHGLFEKQNPTVLDFFQRCQILHIGKIS